MGWSWSWLTKPFGWIAPVQAMKERHAYEMLKLQDQLQAATKERDELKSECGKLHSQLSASKSGLDHLTRQLQKLQPPERLDEFTEDVLLGIAGLRSSKRATVPPDQLTEYQLKLQLAMDRLRLRVLIHRPINASSYKLTQEAREYLEAHGFIKMEKPADSL